MHEERCRDSTFDQAARTSNRQVAPM